MRSRPPYYVTTNIAPDMTGMAYCVRNYEGWDVAYIPGVRGDPGTDETAERVAALPDLIQGLTDIRDGTAYDATAKARAALALGKLPKLDADHNALLRALSTIHKLANEPTLSGYDFASALGQISSLTAQAVALAKPLVEATRALIDIRDSTAYDVAAKARASMALDKLASG